MESWRDRILKEFIPQIHPITLVADPDNLVTEERTLQEIQKRGFTVIVYDDPIEFRYIFETQYRAIWDTGNLQDLVIVGRSIERDRSNFPFDLESNGYILSFKLSDIFPFLSYNVVKLLNTQDWDALYQGQRQANLSVPQGESGTADFVLHHVFQIAPETVKSPHDLLHLLLKRHYGKLRLPPPVEQYLVQNLRQHKSFSDWHLEALVTDQTIFFRFLQERWLPFLNELLRKSGVDALDEEDFSLTVEPPLLLPFDHESVRVYIDNLFAERLLQPVSHIRSDLLQRSGEWIRLGLEINPQADLLRRVERLIKNLKDAIPSGNDAYNKWIEFSHRWATLNLEVNEANAEFGLPDELKQVFQNLQLGIDKSFQDWLLSNYSKLYNQPPSPPVMVHHIPKYLARQLDSKPKRKIALVVVDGMALSQWQVVKRIWQKEGPDWILDEHGVFAWIPTMTSVSRQAIFSGKLPQVFETHITTTANEEKYWQQYWVDEGLNTTQVAYAKSVNHDNLEGVTNIISNPKLRVIGLVVDTVDKIMHGEQLGAAGMQNHVKHWALRGFLRELISTLMDNGFDIWITADHGNTEAIGIGRPDNEGVLVEQKAERVRVYNDEKLRSRFSKNMRNTIEWGGFGLPKSYLCLFAGGRDAFIIKNQTTVSHGGITIDEVIVPFISISQAQ